MSYMSDSHPPQLGSTGTTVKDEKVEVEHVLEQCELLLGV